MRWKHASTRPLLELEADASPDASIPRFNDERTAPGGQQA